MLNRVMQILGKVAHLFTTRFMQQVESALPNVNNSLVKSGQAFQDALAQLPAKPKRKPKASVAQSTKAVASRKAVKKSAPAKRGQAGKQSKTTASKTPQRVKSASKAKP